MKYMTDIFHPILAFAILAVTAIALKGGTEWCKVCCALVGAGAAEAALFAKEGYDILYKKTFWDWRDIKLGQIGVLAGFLCAWLLM